MRGIVRLWENAEENQPLIGCLIISLIHSLLVEIRAILIIQEAKYKLVYLRWSNTKNIIFLSLMLSDCSFTMLLCELP